jgi:Asp-tRNA(Asn)/Glu-tRNA(Gln) amidotransferase A subunit family amidase
MIRPGTFNGIYAYKPTWGSLTREGVKFSAIIYDTLGFFTRSVDDLMILADIFAIHDDVPPSLDFRVEGAKFAMVKTPVWTEAGPGTQSAIEKATSLLRHRGATVEEVTLPEKFSNMRKWYWTILHAEGRVTFLPEHRIGKEHLHQDLIDQVENSLKITRKEQIEAFDSIASLRPVIDEIASRYDALIAPSAPDIAPLGQEITGDQVFNNMWTVSGRL